MAASRAARVSNLRYAVAFTVPSEITGVVGGRVVIGFDLSDAANALALDFQPNERGRLTAARTNLESIRPEIDRGHIVLPATALHAGSNTVTLEFEAGDGPLNRDDDFLYALFVPARAHEVFPCFDQPDLKARWTLALDVPAGWETVANGAEVRTHSDKGRTVVTFAETAPLPTYLFAFSAGRLQIEDAERHGRRIRIFHRETDLAKVARNRDALFDLHAASLSWLETYTDCSYPFGKFDIVLVPSFQFGGMEHPGAIYYNAALMLLEASATEQQYLARASTIAHETAHMWFGDLVTMTWFTDVWMKEVFANFLAAKIVHPLFPAIDHELRFLYSHYPAAYDVDRTAGTNAVRQELDNLKDAGTLYGAIIYLKSPIVMRQLETMLGEDTLRDVLRDYLRAYSFANAAWPDLIALIEARAGSRVAGTLRAWSRAWVEEPGRPIVHTELACTNGAITSLALTQHDPDAARGMTWTQSARVALGYDDRVELVATTLAGTCTEVGEARDRPAPRYVLPNGGGLAYGEFHLDRKSLAWLSQHLPAIPDPLTRGSAWVTLWDALLAGELRVSTWTDLALDALPREDRESTIQYILLALERAYWRFTPEAEQLERAPAIERILAEGLERAATASLKGAYFATLRRVARTDAVCAWLTGVWRGDVTLPGLPLAEADDIQLAQELAVREVSGWDAILDQQIARTTNPERQARLRFMTPALSADVVEREEFFTSLAEVRNRRHEAWVLDGVRYLHHPLRAASALHLLEPGLGLLEEIQRTGDIFFPKRWMEATLGGHRSREAAAIVRAFLAHADASYPDRLRRIVLASADDLFRANRIPQRPWHGPDPGA